MRDCCRAAVTIAVSGEECQCRLILLVAAPRPAAVTGGRFSSLSLDAVAASEGGEIELVIAGPGSGTLHSGVDTALVLDSVTAGSG